MNKDNLFKLLQRLESVISSLTDDEVSKIFDESYHLELRISRKKNKDGTNETLEFDSEAVIKLLTNSISRDEAREFLNKDFNNRKLIQQLAKKLDIPAMKQDNIESLKDKIIESTVGARLRSQAIQGN